VKDRATFDLVIDDIDWLITCNNENRVERGSAIGITEGKIAAIADAGTLQGKERYSAREKLIAPGLINSHTHLAMSLLRGWAEGVNLEGFLKKVWAAEAEIMDEESCALGAQLGALEAIQGGTTTALDMYFHPHATHQAAVEVGLRHVAGPIFFDFPGLDSMQWQDRIAYAKRWPEKVSKIGGPKIPIYLMPHGTYTVSPEHLREIAELADQLDAAIHLHVSETLAENQDISERYQATPVELMERANLLKRHTIYGHGVHLSESDIEITAKYRAGIAHCPGSNMKLGSGLAPLSQYLAAKIPIGLGTDGCSSSNDLDMWRVIRLAAQVQAITATPESVDPATIFNLATLEAAKALGMEETIGSIEIGKAADLMAIDLNQAHLTPIHDIFALLVYSVGRADVTDLWIDGNRVLRDRSAVKVDQEKIIRNARERSLVLEKLR
jgi:5-methylthioadenosine/S-adenosylhomocysteine deaminase